MLRFFKAASKLAKPTNLYSSSSRSFCSHGDQDQPEYCAFFNHTKHAEYDFLSNFHEHPVRSPFGTLKCSEALYQYLKFDHLGDKGLKDQFLKANGQVAYNLSRKLAKLNLIDPNWDREKSMKEALNYKFEDQVMKKKLLSTGSAYLVENAPNGHDPFWSDNGNGTGLNMLGKFLMELRQELGGTGVVPMPEILNLFYKQKCDACSNSIHFTNKKMFYNYCDRHMTQDIKLGNFNISINLSAIPEGTGKFLYFEMNDNDGLVKEGARLVAEYIHSLGLQNPFFVAPGDSTVAMAHRLRVDHKIDGVVLSRQKKAKDFDTYSVDYCAVTSKEKKTLYLDKLQAQNMKGKDIVIIDNVSTTGETIRAVYELLLQAHAGTDSIKEAVVLFTEGNDADHIPISESLNLKLTRFTHLPTFPSDPSIDKSRYHLFSAATIPTIYGMQTLAVYQDRTGNNARDAIAFFNLLPLENKTENVVVRVHDACITSEVFGSLKCDCELQLTQAKKNVSQHGGMIIYLNQEGRGIGLANKIAAYNLQQTRGLDTVMANRALGLPDDIRRYEAVKDILKEMGIRSIKLMTNNPRKVDCLQKLGITVNGTVPCIVDPQSEAMKNYMKTKATDMGHMIPMDVFGHDAAQK